MMHPDFGARDKLGCAAAAFIFWLLIPVPFWLLSSGFAGGLFVPDFGLAGRGEREVSVIFSLLFYTPLAAVGAFIASARKSRPGRTSDGGHAQN